MRKGVIAIVPAIIAATVITLGSIGVVARVRNHTIEGNVLSSSDKNHGSSENEDSDHETSQSNNTNSNNQLSEDSNHETSQSNNTNSNNQSSDHQNSNIKKDNDNLIPNPTSHPGMTTDDKNKFNNTTEMENEGTKSSSSSANKGRKIRTNFPITVNPQTGQKIVTTPSGIHIVVLPEVAIANMIAAGFPVVLPPEPKPSPTPSSSPPQGSSSATPEASPSLTTTQGGILLTEFNNQLVYEIPAVIKKKFLAILPVDIQVTGIVSADNGNIITIQRSLFDQILTFLSS